MRVDLHCDRLCKDDFTYDVNTGELKTQNALQCFAVFNPTDDAAVYPAALTLFKNTILKEVKGVRTASEGLKILKSGNSCAALTCENIGFTGGRANAIRKLKNDGVIMASLVWNTPNSLAYPNVRAAGGREGRGLTAQGVKAVEYLRHYKIIVDISHLSDGGAAFVLRTAKTPVAASHSNCNGVCPNARNLTDWQLKMLANCGGICGVNFYAKFLGGDGGYAAVAAHIKHIIDAAGEDTPSFGSDWDGVPHGKLKIYPRNMPELLRFLLHSGITPRVLEKICYKNFFRVFKEVAGS